MRIGRRALLRAGLAGGAALALPVGFVWGRDAWRDAWIANAGPTPVTVLARPFDSFAPLTGLGARFGDLAFLGGMDLTCDDPRFGGLSALWIGPDGRRLLALSDHGTWLSASLATVQGRPIGLTDAILAPMLGPDGRALVGTKRFDTESLVVAGGVAYVGIERVHEVLRFAIGESGLAARGQPLPGPPGLKSLPSNKGLEALALLSRGPMAGRLIGIAERSESGDDTPTRGFVLTGGFAEFRVARSDGFDISDCALLPGGDLLLLERAFSVWRGVRLRIRRIPAASIRPGALLDGPEVIRADMTSQIDNMEGLAVHRRADGATILTLISDDNFSSFQKTVLLQFQWLDGTA